METHVRDFATQCGADLVGFASIADFSDAPEGFRPTDIMPKAKTVIVLAKAISSGVINGGNSVVLTANQTNIFEQLDSLAHHIAIFIEKHGFAAMPIPADDPYYYWDEEEKRGAAILSHRHAAVKAGLGVLGKNSLLITPVFGNRVLLVSVLTDARITPSILEGGRDLCPPSCRVCLDTCPVQALSGNYTVTQKLCREHYPGKTPRGHTIYKCWLCRSSCPASKMSASNRHPQRDLG